jgi:hypothetical protein
MLEWFRAGGFNMFVLAGLGVLMVVTAARFARAADPQRLALLRALTWALAFATIAGLASGVISTLTFVVRDPDAARAPLAPLLTGLAESLTNVVLGAAIGVVTWGLVAFGVRRMPPA